MKQLRQSLTDENRIKIEKLNAEKQDLLDQIDHLKENAKLEYRVETEIRTLIDNMTTSHVQSMLENIVAVNNGDKDESELSQTDAAVRALLPELIWSYLGRKIGSRLDRDEARKAEEDVKSELLRAFVELVKQLGEHGNALSAFVENRLVEKDKND